MSLSNIETRTVQRWCNNNIIMLYVGHGEREEKSKDLSYESMFYLSISRFWLFIIISFISLEKQKKENLFNLYTFIFSFCCCCCVFRVFLKETRVEKPKEMEFPVCFLSFFFVYVFDGFLDSSIDFSSSSSFLWVAAVFQTVFSVFFYAATITAAAVFLYLFIKRLCVYVCQLLFFAACSRACRSLILFCCFSLSLFLVY